MSSSASLRDANRLVSEAAGIVSALSSIRSLIVLHLLRRRGPLTTDQVVGELGMAHEHLECVLSDLLACGLVELSGDRFSLTPAAGRRIDYGAVSLDFLVGQVVSSDPGALPNSLPGSFHIRELIGRGATSFTFHATHAASHRDRVLKVFMPGVVTYEQLDAALARRSEVTHGALPDVIDCGLLQILLPTGETVTVSCVVLKYVESGAKTFADFLKTVENPNPLMFERFVEQVGGALAAIEEVGLEHGDLHERNILVTLGKSSMAPPEFWVIDFVGIPSVSSPELHALSDLANFRNHLLRAAVAACEQYTGYSARLLLGERVHRVLDKLRRDQYRSFGELLGDYNRDENQIPEEHFQTPRREPFQWLRVEWIPTADWLFKLFHPVPSRFDTISRFGNTWISGPRGCGKSHYLRVMAFHPNAVIDAAHDHELAEKMRELHYDYRSAFGVLFACRLGEFKSFSPDAMGASRFDAATRRFLKHILVLKIINKTLYNLKEGMEANARVGGTPLVRRPHSYRAFIDFLSERMGSMSVIESQSPGAVVLQCLSMCAARENSAVAVWYDKRRRPDTRLLDESDLDAFFAAVRQTFPDLGDTRFYILVDDASYGNIHYEMQKVLNSLIRAPHSNHCFKVTCDKWLYTLDTADGRAIDPRHEVTYVDLGEISTKAHRDEPIDLSTYMAQVVDLRLKADGFTSGIRELLGKSQDPRTFLSALSLPAARRPRRGEISRRTEPREHALYAGWNIVYSLAHGSVRTLLELIEAIFKENGVTREVQAIPPEGQDEVARRFSERQYKALFMLPEKSGAGDPLGPQAQAVLSAIGEISREYLEHYDTGEHGRWYETISLERLDRAKLCPEAADVLSQLVEHGLLLDEGVTFSRAQFGLCQRYDLNKIFAPAFRTTYRVRNHMYLSAGRLEQLMLHPDRFVAQHRKKLATLAVKSIARREQVSLFGGSRDDAE